MTKDAAARAWQELSALLRERALLESLTSVLSWDEETTMPAAGAAHRAEQQALLAGLIHERDAAPRVADLIDALDGDASDERQAATLRVVRKRLARAIAVPRRLTEELARATIFAQEAWRAAREGGDFALFAPALETVVGLKREEAAAADPGRTAWEVALDEHEPGLSESALAALLGPLEAELGRLVSDGIGRARPEAAGLLARPVDEAVQAAFALEVARAIGFDESRGRLDCAAAHPSTIAIGPRDVRMTIRAEPGDNTAALFCTLHEMGHWLYDVQLPADLWGDPAGEAMSAGLHESQGRLFEAIVGRSRPFWIWCLPRLRRAYGGFGDVSLEGMLAALRRVELGPVRVGADEVSYNLHVAVRCRLEVALLSGALPVADLPAAWNAAYERSLGLRPADDLQGCLQDGHWAAGLFGYFASYALGNLAAAQLYEAALAAEPDLEAAIERGDFGPLRAWLGVHVHAHGSTRGLFERLRAAAGADLSVGPLVRSLEARYGAGG
jgi:carboxypeptidase Taq